MTRVGHAMPSSHPEPEAATAPTRRGFARTAQSWALRSRAPRLHQSRRSSQSWRLCLRDQWTLLRRPGWDGAPANISLSRQHVEPQSPQKKLVMGLPLSPSFLNVLGLPVWMKPSPGMTRLVLYVDCKSSTDVLAGGRKVEHTPEILRQSMQWHRH